MNEHGYIRSIHRKLPKNLYIWKINDNYAGGVPDAYYSGNKNDLWLEYKYLKTIPKRNDTVIDFTKMLSPLQQKWLKERHNEGRNVGVVIGSEFGGLLLMGTEFTTSLSAAEFRIKSIGKDELVFRIIKMVTK